MSIEGRRESLEAKHKGLEEEIDRLSGHPSASDLDLTDLKKEKLAVKDELVRISKEQVSA